MTQQFETEPYLLKLGEKTSLMQQEAEKAAAFIEARDERLTRLEKSFHKEFQEIEVTMRVYREQLEQAKKDILSLFRVYKLCTRKEKFEKLKERAEKIYFEKLITRDEFSELIARHASKR